MTKHTFKAAALASALLITTSQAFSFDSQGTMKCQDVLQEFKHDPEKSDYVFKTWFSGLLTGVYLSNSSTWEKTGITPRSSDPLFKQVLEECSAEPSLHFAEAAIKALTGVLEKSKRRLMEQKGETE
jgi:hypothetical protein